MHGKTCKLITLIAMICRKNIKYLLLVAILSVITLLIYYMDVKIIDSILCFSAWLKKFEGLWIALQGIGIPLSILLALFLPYKQKRKMELEKVVSHRNITFFVERFVRVHIAPHLREGRSVDGFLDGYLVCLKEFDRLNRSEILPARLIEKFVDFSNYAHMMPRLMNLESLCREDRDLLGAIEFRLTDDIAVIDAYLRTQAIKFDADNIAHI